MTHYSTVDNRLSSRLMRHHAMSRAAILVQATLTASLNLLAPESLSARLIVAGGEFALAVAILFAAAVGLSLMDWIVNDLMPDGYAADRLAQSRHISYSAIGGGYLIQAMALAGVVASVPGGEVLLLAYVASAAVCGWHAIVSAAEAGEKAHAQG